MNHNTDDMTAKEAEQELLKKRDKLPIKDRRHELKKSLYFFLMDRDFDSDEAFTIADTVVESKYGKGV
ncbi:hypothetical protein GPK34_00545 [Secundilactobacillus kimchicus]|uniref:hypothetical protein n=1 Tax=Secundilactobacillus kimchicus TaxID=528209 RepID=UPI001C0240D7|nr:hypothetical protein [Secundilactobacillus kimchicus]MBT9670526.1 hypothetical protein [Secundilactobacillus kimchicus]